jgi:preprotein translocase subunit SecE
MVKHKRPVAQLAEQRSPKPQVAGSSPSWPAKMFGRVNRFFHRIWNAFKRTWLFFQEVRIEAMRVTWPSLQEVMQSAFVIGIVILIISLFLWGIDSLILYVIKWLASQKG